MPEAKEKPILLLVDGHSLAFRSFYAFAKGGEGGLSTKDGKPTRLKLALKKWGFGSKEAAAKFAANNKARA